MTAKIAGGPNGDLVLTTRELRLGILHGLLRFALQLALAPFFFPRRFGLGTQLERNGRVGHQRQRVVGMMEGFLEVVLVETFLSPIQVPRGTDCPARARAPFFSAAAAGPDGARQRPRAVAFSESAWSMRSDADAKSSPARASLARVSHS